MNLPFPTTRKSKDEILEAMRAVRDHDLKWEQGRVFGLVYHISDEVDDLLQSSFNLFFAENGLNPTAFPSLRKFETEIVAMTASLLGGDGNVVGNVTSGGTESLLCVVKTARDWARVHRPDIKEPEIIIPVSGHPAFDKGGEYFGVKIVHTPVRADLRADVDAMKAAITPNTIMLVGSAPSYPHGLVDPIDQMAAIAEERSLLFHVDACVGGFMLPFVRKAGYPVPDFDFRLPGVTSMSADLHKYGYSAKGASVILYRNAALRRHQMFVYTDWTGGIYPSPTMAGTRPAGPIAAAWAILNYLGEEGYVEITHAVMHAVRKIQAGIAGIPGIRVLGEPEMSVIALGSDGVDVYEVGDELSARGWHLDRQHYPPSLHMTINYAHVEVVGEFLADLRASVDAVRKSKVSHVTNTVLVKAANVLVRILPETWVSRIMSKASALLKSGKNGDGSGLPGKMAPMYGLIGSLPNRGDLKEMVLDLLEQMTTYSGD